MNSKDGIIGLIIGDALGVPVEFKSREELEKNPIEKMIGYGTYNKAPGTFSDDSSLTLATIDSIIEHPEIDYEDMITRFSNWYHNGDYTSDGETFDVGHTTVLAISRYNEGVNPLKCGGGYEHDNGNGSLMRILPIAYLINERMSSEDVELIYNVSGLTHNHKRSKIACHLYCQIAVKLLNNDISIKDSINQSIDEILKYYKDDKEFNMERGRFERIFSGEIFDLDMDDIKSSGYVIDTLEAVLWTLANTNSYREALLKSVNLGSDTDTVGAICGGLAGIYYGYDSIPEEWLNTIERKEDILNLLDDFDKTINKE